MTHDSLLALEPLLARAHLSLFGVMALTLGMETLAWRPLIFTLSGLTDRSVWPWEMFREPGVVPSVLDSLCSCLPVWLCVDPYSKRWDISHLATKALFKWRGSKHLEQKDVFHTVDTQLTYLTLLQELQLFHQVICFSNIDYSTVSQYSKTSIFAFLYLQTQ